MDKKTNPQKNPGKQTRTGRRQTKTTVSKPKSAPRKNQAMQLAAELIWADPKDGQKIARKLLTACLSNTRELVRNLQAKNDQKTVQASFALEAMAMLASAPDQEKRRQSLARALEQSLKDTRDAVAKEIVLSFLQRIGSQENVATLGKILVSDRDCFAPALLALQYIGGDEAAREIHRALSKVTPEQQVLLAAALLNDEEECEPAYLDSALEVWRKPDNQDNPLLWLALSQQGCSEILPNLLAALQNDSETLAAVARASLLRLAHNCENIEDLAQVIAELYRLEPQRPSTWHALLTYDVENADLIGQLIILLMEENPALKQVAIDFLSQDCQHAFLTDILIYFCQELKGHADNEQHYAALLSLIEILGQRGDTAARPFLMSLLHDSDAAIRRAAISAMERLCGPLPSGALSAVVQL